MSVASSRKPKLALVFGQVPSADEVDQFALIKDHFDVNIVCGQSVAEFIAQNSRWNELQITALPDYDQNPSYIPGLEKALMNFDVVVVKERLGLFAYQAVKAKQSKNFKLFTWVDNLQAFPGDDIGQMRTVRREITLASDAFLVQSEGARQALLLEGVNDEKIYKFSAWVAGYGERSKKSKAQALEQLGMQETDYLVSYIGQIEWEESLYDLVDAVKILTQQNASMRRRLKVIIAGYGSLADDLRQRVTTLGLENRVFYVVPNRVSVSTILTASDALFLGTMSSRDRQDGDPFRSLMAVAAKLPVIACRNQMIEETLGKHRIDFCAGSVPALAEAILKSQEATQLTHDIVQKYDAKLNQWAKREKIRDELLTIFMNIQASPTLVANVNWTEKNEQVEDLIKKKDYLSAVEVIEGLFKVPGIPTTERSTLYRLIGDCFVKLGDLDTGKSAYQKSIEISEQSARSYIGLGTVALLKSQHDVAVVQFQKAISYAANDDMANLGLGLAFQGMGEHTQAIVWMNKALEINNDNTAAIFSLVKLSYEMNQFSDAEASLIKYLAKNTEDHNMRFSLAGVYFSQNKLVDALNITQDLLKVMPNDSRVNVLYTQITDGLKSKDQDQVRSAV